MILAMIFDLDGTLVKTEWLKSLSYAKAIQLLSPKPVTTEDVQQVFTEVIGRSREVVASTLVERFGLQEATRERMADTQAQQPWQVLTDVRLKIYSEMLANAKVLRGSQWPHNVELLRIARRTGCRTALASMSSREQVLYILQVIGLANQFDVILTREDVECPKPDPEIYLQAARRLTLRPEQCLVIEDSPVGVQAALAAGMNCIAVTSPFTRQGLRVYRDTLVVRQDPRGKPYYWIGGEAPTGVREDGTDFGALAKGYVSITPLQLDLTAYASLDELRLWKW